MGFNKAATLSPTWRPVITCNLRLMTWTNWITNLCIPCLPNTLTVCADRWQFLRYRPRPTHGYRQTSSPSKHVTHYPIHKLLPVKNKFMFCKIIKDMWLWPHNGVFKVPFTKVDNLKMLMYQTAVLHTSYWMDQDRLECKEVDSLRYHDAGEACARDTSTALCQNCQAEKHKLSFKFFH